MSTPSTHAPPALAPPPLADDAKDHKTRTEEALADPSVRQSLMNWALVRVGSKSTIEADEIVQEAIVRALKKADTYDPTQASVTAWATGFLKNVLLEARRQVAKSPRTGVDLGAGRKLRVVDEREFDDADQRFRVQRHYDKLPNDFQAVVKMKYFLGLDGPAAAARLGLGYDIYRQRLCRALVKLRELAGASPKGGVS